MNTVSLNNLWNYLQGLKLTSSNKKWLADHLYQSALSQSQHDQQAEEEFWENAPLLTQDDLIPSQEILSIVSEVEPMPQDIDAEKLVSDYLAKKYR